MPKWAPGLLLGLAVLSAIFISLTVSVPLGLSVGLKQTGPFKYQVEIIPLYRVQYAKGGPPYIVVVLDVKEFGIPPMRNVQVWAKGPTVGKYEIKDFEQRGNVIKIPINGDFRKAVDDWVANGSGHIEVPVEIDVWFGDTHFGVALAHFIPREVATMKQGEYVIKARVYVSEKPLKSRQKMG